MFELTIYALIAAFIITKLYSSFGKISEGEDYTNQDDFFITTRQKEININEAKSEEEDKLLSKLEIIDRDALFFMISKYREFDKTFFLHEFIETSTSVIEYVITSLRKHDIAGVKHLLTKEFSEILEKKGFDKEPISGSFISSKCVGVREISLNSSFATISLRFNGEFMIHKNIHENKSNGSEYVTKKIDEVWFFCKDLTDSSPEWLICNVQPFLK